MGEVRIFTYFPLLNMPLKFGFSLRLLKSQVIHTQGCPIGPDGPFLRPPSYPISQDGMVDTPDKCQMEFFAKTHFTV